MNSQIWLGGDKVTNIAIALVVVSVIGLASLLIYYAVLKRRYSNKGRRKFTRRIKIKREKWMEKYKRKNKKRRSRRNNIKTR